MNREPQPEDDTILAAIASLEKAAAAEPGGPPNEAAETLERLYVELLGLLAYQLPPLAPAPEVKQRLMAAITGDETQEVREGALAKVHAVPVQRPEAPPGQPGTHPEAAQGVAPPDRDLTPPWPKLLQTPLPANPAVKTVEAGGAAQPAHGREPQPLPGARASTATRPEKSRPMVAPGRFPLGLGPQGLLAAAVIVLLVAANVFLAARVIDQRRTIAFLDHRLRVEGDLALRRIATASSASRELEDLRRKLSLVTSPSVAVSPLQPAGSPAPQPAAHGVVFVAADHQHWYLSVAGLTPTAPGRSYQLWFINDAGPQSAGVFRVADERPLELASPQMPLGTREVKVTLEPESGSPRPSGPEILASTQFRTL